MTYIAISHSTISKIDFHQNKNNVFFIPKEISPKYMLYILTIINAFTMEITMHWSTTCHRTHPTATILLGCFPGLLFHPVGDVVKPTSSIAVQSSPDMTNSCRLCNIALIHAGCHRIRYCMPGWIHALCSYYCSESVDIHCHDRQDFHDKFNS